MKPMTLFVAAGALLAFSINTPSLAQQPTANGQHMKGPLILKEQGTFFVGGKIEYRQPNSTVIGGTKVGNGNARFAAGDIAVDQMYVEYQVPATLRYKYPIVMVHGGGHTGAVFHTTPDGREGWFTSFTRRGFAVYVVDAPNRGRSGWDPTNRIAVSLGLKPPSALEPVNIYSAQAAWTAFRWGPKYQVPFPGQQFPIDHLKEYLPQMVPSYRDAPENDLIAEDLQALMKRIGPCILLGWSTGSGNVMAAASADIDAAKAVVTIEVVEADLANPKIDPAKLARIPFLSVFGDNRTADYSKAYTNKLSGLGGDATTISLPEIGIKGNGHAMMLERNNEQIADLIEKWIGKHVLN